MSNFWIDARGLRGHPLTSDGTNLCRNVTPNPVPSPESETTVNLQLLNEWENNKQTLWTEHQNDRKYYWRLSDISYLGNCDEIVHLIKDCQKEFDYDPENEVQHLCTSLRSLYLVHHQRKKFERIIEKVFFEKKF